MQLFPFRSAMAPASAPHGSREMNASREKESEEAGEGDYFFFF